MSTPNKICTLNCNIIRYHRSCIGICVDLLLITLIYCPCFYRTLTIRSLNLLWYDEKHFPFSILFSFYWSLHFCSTKCTDSLTVKRLNSFQTKNNEKATHDFAPRSLIFKLQQKVLKSNDIFVSCSSPKTELMTNF